MSIKDLFGKKSTKILASTNLEELSTDVESEEYIVQEIEERKLIKPDIDYTEPKNFAFYGSATKYYTDAIEGIAKKYPYDGSAAEKIKWKKESSDLQNYIFDNEYPKNNGYINMGYNYGTTSSVSTDDYSNPTTKEYIFIKGGPNAPIETVSRTSQLFGTSNILDASQNRESNLLLDGNNGATIEFWIKKDNLSGSSRQVVFDLWNSASFGSDYGRLTIELHPGTPVEKDKFYIQILSGTNGVIKTELGDGLDINNASWQHYSITAINSGSSLELKLFRNGILNDSAITGS